jgi:hypothetical protein
MAFGYWVGGRPFVVKRFGLLDRTNSGGTTLKQPLAR